MAKVLSSGAPLPVPQSNDPAVLQQYLVRQAQNLRANFVTISERVNDEVLVRPDWIRPLDEDYLALPSDRILLVYPPGGGSVRTVTLPLTADWDEPHAITIRSMTIGATVDVVATAPEATNPALIELAGGTAMTLVPLWQEVVDRAGVGVDGWVAIMDLSP